MNAFESTAARLTFCRWMRRGSIQAGALVPLRFAARLLQEEARICARNRSPFLQFRAVVAMSRVENKAESRGECSTILFVYFCRIERV